MVSTESQYGKSQVSYLFNSPLPITRYRFTAIVQQPLSLPDYAGSLLRGQFGAALRNLACMTRQPVCSGCPLLQTCPYTRIFEVPAPPKGTHALQAFSNIPQPYVIEPPAPGARVLAAGDVLMFHLVLVGDALNQLALIVFAMQRMLAQGLTRERVPAGLQSVECIDADGTARPVWSYQQPTLAEHSTVLNVPDMPAGLAAITLQIHTPMRLQRQGQPLGVGQLTPRALVAAVARRAALQLEFHAGLQDLGQAVQQATQASETLADDRDLHWHDWTRYSSRQQQAMTLGGVQGRWTLRGSAEAVAQVWPWLWLGQWLHVGKETMMGMGGYTVESAIY